jgi:hypothetical protein
MAIDVTALVDRYHPLTLDRFLAAGTAAPSRAGRIRPDAWFACIPGCPV